MIGKLQKWGNSQGIRLPKHLLAEASFTEGDEVEIVAEESRIILRHPPKRRKEYTIQELFAGYVADSPPPAPDWGAPRGKEEW